MNAIDHYEAALKAAFPNGASGVVFDHWNKARKHTEQLEHNFCPRCGKRLSSDNIHTCTPPAEKQEPKYYKHEDNHLMTPERAKFLGFDLSTLEPLYTHPPQRQPLTDEQIHAVIRSGEYDSMEDFARAIEAAHGIKGQA